MNKRDIETLVHFNFWANGRILAACERITTDQFTQAPTLDPGWGSLRGVLVHTLDTELGWRTALQGIEDTILEAANFPTVAALKGHWLGEEAAWFDYISRLDDEQLAQSYGEDAQNGRTVWQVIMHVIAHGIQHRSEAAVILTEYGRSPGELDFGQFLQQ